MGKIKPSEKEIEDFHERLSTIIAEEPSIEEALNRLRRYKPDLLAGILESYYNESIVFEELIIEEKSSLMQLMFYFLSINPDILTKPLKVKNDAICRDTALTFFTEVKAQYPGVYAWIEQNAQAPLKAEIQRMQMLETLLNEACSYIETNQFSNFQILMERTPLETRLDLLTLYDHNILTKLLVEPNNLPYLMFLIDTDIRTLKTTMWGRTIAEILETKREYQPALYLLAQNHPDSLSEEEQGMLPPIPQEERDCFPALNRGSYPDKLASILLLTNARPNQFPILTLPLLMQLFPSFNAALLPSANTQVEVEISVLDAFLFQTCWETLDARGIALMPTIESTQAINPEQLMAIFLGGNSFTTGIEISANHITPITESVSNKENITHAIWPVVANGRYGLFILDLTRTDVAFAGRGIYIEPSRLSKVAESLCYTNSGVALPTFNYQHYVSKLTQHLSMQPGNFSFIFLSQKVGESSSDYVIAIVMLLALGKLDLIKNPNILEHLQGRYLSKDVARAIRVCQLQLFGEAYIKYQKLTEPSDVDENMSVDTVSDSVDSSEPPPKISCLSRDGMFSATFSPVYQPTEEQYSVTNP